MDFNLSQEQQMLQDTAARLVRDQYTFEARQAHAASALGYSRPFWAQLGELGLTAVPFDEHLGGMGGGSVDVMLIMTELGRGLCLEPYLHSVVFAGGLLAQLGTAPQLERWLAPVTTGEAQLAVAFEEPHSHYHLNHVETRAQAVPDGYRLSGRKVAVIGGHSADAIIVSARTHGEPGDESGISLLVLEPDTPGVRRRDYPTVDGPRACELFLDDVVVPASTVLGNVGQAFDALRYQQGRAIAAQCAEALGSMQAACELTLDYLKTRKQFGVPIGKFQVLQHRMVDMQTELEQATSMAILAATFADGEDNDDRRRIIAAAKYICARAARKVAEEAIQLHGGIGMTWEYNLAHHAKRLVMIAHQFGDDDHHLKAFAKLMQVA